MKFISNTNSRELVRKPFYKKVYVLIFILAIVAIIIALSITFASSFIPEVNYGDPDYDAYLKLIERLSALSTFFQNLGIALFSVSLFIGAILDESISKDVRKGMIIASGIGIVALVLSRTMILFGFYP